MIGELSEFLWEVPERGDGFEWVHCRKNYPILIRKEGAAFASRNLLKGSVALYRVFAETEPSPERILAFANQYGSLSTDPHIRSRLQKVSRSLVLGGPLECAESQSKWRHALFDIRECLRIWSLIECEQRGLAKCFERRGTDFYYVASEKDIKRYSLETEFLTAISDESPVPLSEHKGHLAQAAFLWVGKRLAKLMREDVSPVAQWDCDRHTLQFRDQPTSLLAAISLQLALAIQNATPFRRCEVCGRPFELAPGKNRSDRQTCSQTCRNRLHLNRQARARELHAAGKTLKQIAKQLGSDESTIEGWLTNPEE
jgi:predicted nucleic acid-binding Zn ribbon protein